MPSILFILILALIIFGPRKLLDITSRMAPSTHSWKKLFGLMTGSGSAGCQEPISAPESSVEPPNYLAARAEPFPLLAEPMGGE